MAIGIVIRELAPWTGLVHWTTGATKRHVRRNVAILDDPVSGDRANKKDNIIKQKSSLATLKGSKVSR